MIKLGLLLLVVAACGPREVPLPDDTPGLAEAACANLRALGCPEGNGSVGLATCKDVMVNASRLRPLPLACWASKHTIPEAKGCGSLRCVPQ